MWIPEPTAQRKLSQNIPRGATPASYTQDIIDVIFFVRTLSIVWSLMEQYVSEFGSASVTRQSKIHRRRYSQSRSTTLKIR